MSHFTTSTPYFICIFLKQGLSLNLELTNLAEPVALQGPGTSVSLNPVLKFHFESPSLLLLNWI